MILQQSEYLELFTCFEIAVEGKKKKKETSH